MRQQVINRRAGGQAGRQAGGQAGRQSRAYVTCHPSTPHKHLGPSLSRLPRISVNTIH